MSKFLFFFLFSTSALAQSGTIKGTIVNPRVGEPFPFVNLILDSTNFVTHSNLDGSFHFLRIPPGNYNLRIKYPGYADSVIQAISLKSGGVIEINISYPAKCTEVNDIQNKRCPVCHKKNQVVPIIWGLPSAEAVYEAEKGRFFLGGCLVSECDPLWYCKIDKKKFTN